MKEFNQLFSFFLKPSIENMVLFPSIANFHHISSSFILQAEEFIEFGYFKDSIEFLCKYDYVDSLIINFAKPEFDFSMKVLISCLDTPFNLEQPPQSLLSLSAFYGAHHSFKVILLNYLSINEITIKSAVQGGSLEILTMIEMVNGDFSLHYSDALLYSRNDIANWIILNYNVKDVVPLNGLISMNVQSFFLL
jgi:hypothetical protein